MATAICPGSFDPFTNGHLDIVERAANIFNEVVVLVLNNAKKIPTFKTAQRLEFIRRSTDHLANVRADYFDGLLSEYAKAEGVKVFIKGLRAISDFEYEFQMALMNKKLLPGAETFFVTTNAEYMFLSSSIVKQLAKFGKEITGFVPSVIEDDIIRAIRGESR